MSDIFAGEVDVLHQDLQKLLDSRLKFVPVEAVVLVLRRELTHFECVHNLDLEETYSVLLAERNAKRNANKGIEND